GRGGRSLRIFFWVQDAVPFRIFGDVRLDRLAELRVLEARLEPFLERFAPCSHLQPGLGFGVGDVVIVLRFYGFLAGEMRLARGKSVAEGLWHRFEERAIRPGSDGELGAMAREELARLCSDRVATGFVHGGSSGFYVQSYVSRFGMQDHRASCCGGRK